MDENEDRAVPNMSRRGGRRRQLNLSTHVAEKVLNQENDYKYNLLIMAGVSTVLEVKFYFKGTLDQIGEAQPVRLMIEPKPVESLVPIYVGVGCTLLLMPLSVWVYKQATSRGIERGKEKRLKAADKLALLIGNRRKVQYFWLGEEERREKSEKRTSESTRILFIT